MAKSAELRVIGVVEDSDEDFLMLQRGFAGQPSVLHRWEQAEAALADWQAGSPPLAQFDVLVVDVTLSGMDGCELVEHVRELPEGRDLPICVLSGSERVSEPERAIRAGADRYVVKPSSAAGLRALPRLLKELREDPDLRTRRRA